VTSLFQGLFISHAECRRWKAVTLYEPKSNSLLVHGGDPLGSDGLGKGYLNDVWRLDLSADLTLPTWKRLEVVKGGKILNSNSCPVGMSLS
jgi:hypothetical protein